MHPLPTSGLKPQASSLRSHALSVAAAGAVVAAWLLPSPGGDYLLGRYQAHHFLLALAVTLAAGVIIGWTEFATTRHSRMKLAAAALSAVISWLLVELAMYVLIPWPVNPFYHDVAGSSTELDASVRYKRRPNIQWQGRSMGEQGSNGPFAMDVEFRTDSDGFRNSSELNAVDLAFIGDSFTEAGNVPEAQTFAHRMARKLGATAGIWGVAGYGPLEEVAVLEHYVLPRRPGWVVWQLCEANDLWDVVDYLYWQQQNLAQRTSVSWSNRMSDAWKRWRHTSPLIRGLRSLSLHESHLYAFEGSYRTSDARVIPMRFGVLPSEHTDPSHQPLRWKLTAKAILKGRQLCRQHNAELLLVFIPIKLRVTGPYTVFSPEAAGRYQQSTAVQPDFATVVARFAERQGIMFIDLTESLRHVAAAGHSTYFAFDSHLSPRGHQVLADAAVERIRQAESQDESRD